MYWIVNITGALFMNNNYAAYSIIWFGLLVNMFCYSLSYGDQEPPPIIYHPEIFQNIYNIDQLVSEYSQQVERTQSVAVKPDFNAFFQAECDTLIEESETDKLRYEKEECLKDIGLKIEVGAALKTSELTPDELEPVDARGEGYFGISWDLMRDGLVQNRSKACIRSHLMRIRELQLYRNKVKNSFSCAYNKLIAGFNTKKRQLLVLHKEFLNSIRPFIENLYYLGVIYIDDVLEIRKTVKQIDNRMESCRQYLHEYSCEFVANFEESFYPVVDVRIRELIHAVENDPLFYQTASIQKDILDEKYSAVNDIRLRIYARGYVDDRDDHLKNRMAGGVSVSLPLPIQNHQKLKEVETLLNIKQHNQQQRETINRLMEEYYDFRYKFDDIIKLRHQFEKFTERLRRSLIKSEPILDSDPLHRLRLFSNILDTQFELIETKEKLYLKLLKMFLYAGIPEFGDYLDIAPINDENIKKVRTGSREIYIWSDELNRVSTEYLFDLLSVKTVDTLIISFGKKTDQKKLQQVVEQAHSHGISVYLMMSATEWLFPENWDQVSRFLAETKNYPTIHGIHLDIEPQHLADWKEKTDTYMTYYVELLKRIKLMYSKPVGVSIPVFYPKQYLSVIFSYADRVNIMAYGIKSIVKLNEKCKEEFEINKAKITVALRCSDFENELEFEALITRIDEDLGVPRFAIYDFKLFEDLIKQK